MPTHRAVRFHLDTEGAMFARFGPEVRRVIELSEDHARALGRPAVGPEHLLLALLAVDDTGTLQRAGLAFDALRSVLVAATPPASSLRAGREERGSLPLRLREIFRSAFRHAAMLGAREVRPLHLAFALSDDPPGEISLVFRHLDVKAEEVRDAVTAALLGDDAERKGRVVALPRRPHAASAGRSVGALGDLPRVGGL